jgi:hypothetical protein
MYGSTVQNFNTITIEGSNVKLFLSLRKNYIFNALSNFASDFSKKQ